MNLEEFRKALSSDATEENAQLKRQLSDLQTEYHEKLSKLENENDSLKESCRVLCNRCFTLTRGVTCRWKEFDTYKVGTVANSCSTMHKIADKEFTLEDFSHEHLLSMANNDAGDALFLNDANNIRVDGDDLLGLIINVLNYYRGRYIKTKDKRYWWQLIQLLPSSYNQRRTVMLNYEVLANIYKSRRNHKLDEWHTFCDWIESLPYSKLITGEKKG